MLHVLTVFVGIVFSCGNFDFSSSSSSSSSNSSSIVVVVIVAVILILTAIVKQNFPSYSLSIKAT
jgi:phosphotransferase system  glucose/maltose/N-acetylglucosamine-specific IIC component